MNTNNFNENQLYAVKESHNLAMVNSGSSVASLLNASVWITDPEVKMYRIMDFIYAELAPTVFVKISYTGEKEGTAVLIFRQEDAQLMLCQLMGMPLVATPDFTFDEINTSAFSEVINQMMTTYFTEISGLIGSAVMISAAEVLPNSSSQNIFQLMGLNPDDTICTVSSSLRVDNTINNKFITVISTELASEIAEKTESRFPMPETPAEPPAEEPATNMPDFSTSPEENNPFDTTGADDSQSIFNLSPEEDALSAALNQPSAFTALSEQNTFSSFQGTLTSEQLNNLQLLMNVPLELAIEIGSTQKKVDDILSFSHGTIIELDSPADAPVSVIVNGHLIARGDVVVVDDYFAVRITEIIKSNLIDTLRSRN
ncbi:MAG: flagellar motor switch protein FliN [Oscillospiraceae bacterium]|nr:flagellar motor switch protein FliN [Oscillospiraceae bacterium]